MYADQAAKNAVPTPATLNQRLNKVLDGIQFQCERLESVLGRVNGTPQREGRSPRDASVAQINPTHALANVVEMLEQAQSRLSDLTANVEQIA